MVSLLGILDIKPPLSTTFKSFRVFSTSANSLDFSSFSSNFSAALSALSSSEPARMSLRSFSNSFFWVSPSLIAALISVFSKPFTAGLLLGQSN
jgi:hypothetical protein